MNAPPGSTPPPAAPAVPEVARTLPFQRVRPVTQKMAAAPDPLPRILDQIDPPAPGGFDLSTILVLGLLASAILGLVLWLIIR